MKTTNVSRFPALAAQWRRETAAMSSITDMSMNAAYQHIVGMGWPVVPVLLRELERKPDHWFWALWAITGADPVSPRDQGDIDAMAAAWLRWGRANDLL